MRSMNFPALTLLVALAWNLLAPMVAMHSTRDPREGQTIAVGEVDSDSTLLCASGSGESLKKLDRLPVDEFEWSIVSTLVGRRTSAQVTRAADVVLLASHPFSRWRSRMRARSTDGDLPA